MSDIPCTFGATPGPLYPTYEKISSQPGCCVTDTTGTITTAYGINNTCHVLRYNGNAQPYTLTLKDQSAGDLKLTTGQCIAMVMEIQSKGEFSTGNGKGPTDGGLASKYGYKGCKVGAASSPDSASSSANLMSNPVLSTKAVLLLGLILPALLL